jgi:hypothetical protein
MRCLFATCKSRPYGTNTPTGGRALKRLPRNQRRWASSFRFGNRHDDLPAHYLSLQMGVCVVLPSPVVLVVGCWRVRRQFFQPDFIIMQEPILRIIYEN